MWPILIVVTASAGDYCSGLTQRLESMLPDAFLLKKSEKALDDSVMLRSIGRRSLCSEPVATFRVIVVVEQAAKPFEHINLQISLIYPALDLGYGDIVLASHFSYGGLAFEDVYDNSGFALRHLAFDGKKTDSFDFL